MLPHLLLFQSFSSLLRILPNQMLLSHYFRLNDNIKDLQAAFIISLVSPISFF